MHSQQFTMVQYTLKTYIPVEEGDCILKLLRRVSRPEIQLGVAFHSELDLLSTVKEFTFQVRSKLLTFSLRELSTSSFILNISDCTFDFTLYICETQALIKSTITQKEGKHPVANS